MHVAERGIVEIERVRERGSVWVWNRIGRTNDRIRVLRLGVDVKVGASAKGETKGVVVLLQVEEALKEREREESEEGECGIDTQLPHKQTHFGRDGRCELLVRELVVVRQALDERDRVSNLGPVLVDDLVQLL